MEVYLVGGAVRDQLLGLTVTEKDWVVVGATAEEMLELGYLPVGRSFPVFLHPKTKEEYALARTERKVAPGYKGFVFHAEPTVTLEQDLKRRDLTINAIAQSKTGEIIDPFDGQADINNRILRHVSEAFVEDPVRVLRVARFATRFKYLGFTVADETMHLMADLVHLGEINALVPERIWKELLLALQETNAVVFFKVLNECGALSELSPELYQYQDAAYQLLDVACGITTDSVVRLASMLYCFNQSNEPLALLKGLSARIKIPKQFYMLSQLVLQHADTIVQINQRNAQVICELFAQLDVIRKWDRFEQFLQVVEIIATLNSQKFDAGWFLACAQVFVEVKVDQLTLSGLSHQAIQQAIQKLRIQAIANFIKH